MKHGVPCTSGWGDCLSTAVKDSVSIGVPPRAPRSAGAVMFMSATCDRHEGYAPPPQKKLWMPPRTRDAKRMHHSSQEEAGAL
jgi:hypothetical protein